MGHRQQWQQQKRVSEHGTVQLEKESERFLLKNPRGSKTCNPQCFSLMCSHPAERTEDEVWDRREGGGTVTHHLAQRVNGWIRPPSNVSMASVTDFLTHTPQTRSWRSLSGFFHTHIHPHTQRECFSVECTLLHRFPPLLHLVGWSSIGWLLSAWRLLKVNFTTVAVDKTIIIVSKKHINYLSNLRFLAFWYSVIGRRAGLGFPYTLPLYTTLQEVVNCTKWKCNKMSAALSNTHYSALKLFFFMLLLLLHTDRVVHVLDVQAQTGLEPNILQWLL